MLQAVQSIHVEERCPDLKPHWPSSEEVLFYLWTQPGYLSASVSNLYAKLKTTGSGYKVSLQQCVWYLDIYLAVQERN